MSFVFQKKRNHTVCEFVVVFFNSSKTSVVNLGLLNISLTSSMHTYVVFQKEGFLRCCQSFMLFVPEFPILSLDLSCSHMHLHSDCCSLSHGIELPTKVGRCLWWKECSVI